MREIKFRVIEKCKDGTYEIWDNHCGDWQLRFEDGDKPTLWVFNYDQGYWDRLINGEIEVYQSTELHDKNGVEIYEGDLVEVDGETFEVIVNDFTKIFAIDGDAGQEYLYKIHHKCEVINTK